MIISLLGSKDLERKFDPVPKMCNLKKNTFMLDKMIAFHVFDTFSENCLISKSFQIKGGYPLNFLCKNSK